MNNTNKKARISLIISRILAYGFVIFLCFLCLFCFVLLILMASKSNSQMQGAFNFKWGGHFMENLNNAWNDFSINIPVGMVNSFIVAMSSSLITTYFSALTAYGIHVYNFKLKNFIFTFIMAIMMIPSQVSAVGFIQLAYKFGLTNKLWLLIIPSIAAPVVFFYMKQYLESVLPLEMVEAARIDGSNEFRIFNEIVLPIMKPAVAVQMIFSFVSSWNNYFMPSLLLTKEKYKTVPIMIANLRSADYSKFDQGKVFMFILLAILPVMIVYTILSKSIIKGVTSGSVKG
ncbi:MAG: carbohydrate ABC transporter permease [Erysipelotrichaceae bacterium]|nr:carbohydrate ABC transporter permease [Erysipelotrichaceae bacterium]